MIFHRIVNFLYLFNQNQGRKKLIPIYRVKGIKNKVIVKDLAPIYTGANGSKHIRVPM